MRLLLTMLCALTVVPLAHAYEVEGARWPGPTISVWNTTSYKSPVREAEKAWSASGAAIRFVPAADRASADVVVSYGPPHAQGAASVGYAPGESSVSLPKGMTPMIATTLAAHELGHVLGLGHEVRGCTVMAPVVMAGPASRCGIANCKPLWRCIVQKDDAAGAAALYGRRASG
jgi:hypothetical protein